jgi:hypothetical protein
MSTMYPTLRLGVIVFNLILICRFANRCHRFVHAYAGGLDGPFAAWACRKYPGHRMIPAKLYEQIDSMPEKQQVQMLGK